MFKNMSTGGKIATAALAIGVLVFIADQYKKRKDNDSFVIESNEELEEPMVRPSSQMETRPAQVAA